VSAEQREKLDAAARQSAFPVDSDVHEQRRLLHDLMSSQPLPAGVTVTEAELGGVRTAEITVEEIEPRHVSISTAACTHWVTPSSPPTWHRRSFAGPAPGRFPSTTGPVLDEAAAALDRAGQRLSA
jgi:hypothetical protein